MSDELVIGPLLACALGDAYGAGFEFAPAARVKAHNNLTGYIQHQKWKGLKPGRYTDDTQMAMGLLEHMLSDPPTFTPLRLAERWVEGFHRDVRAGYAGGFYKLLCQTQTGEAFLRCIQPHSAKSGGAMRAFPCGLLTDWNEVRDKAMMQASLTHATFDGMRAAAAAALAFHYAYHRVGPKTDLPQWVSNLVGYDFGKEWVGHVGGAGLDIVHAAIESYMQGDSLMDVLHKSIAWTGDVDTVAAIAMPIAAVCPETKLNVAGPLYNGLEDGLYGRTYIEKLDVRLLEKFPPAWKRSSDMEVARQAKRKAKKEKAEKAQKTAEAEADEGPLDFLFDMED